HRRLRRRGLLPPLDPAADHGAPALRRARLRSGRRAAGRDRGPRHPAAHEDPARAHRAPVHREGEGSLVSAHDTATATVQMTGITVDFGPVRALDGVDLTLRPGEIHALMGENGAGKSTLINVLAGVVTPASGSIVLEGAPVRFSTAADAQAASVAAVLQDVPLSQHLSIGENVMLGHEPHGRWGIRWNDLHARAHQM